MTKGPVDLVLVRHGESEGNLAQIRSQHGNQVDWQGEFSHRHTSRYRLTDEGREQARRAGEYIKHHVYERFDRYYTSEYARAMETAGLLQLPDAEWFVDFTIRERDKGILGGKSKAERQDQYSDELARRDRDVFYWEPPGGESIANMCMRIFRFLNAIKSSCAGLKVIVVCHGNIMEGFRLIMENMTQRRYREIHDHPTPEETLHNGQIIWYTRRDPVTHKLSSNYDWMKSICPWDLSRSFNEWRPIIRPAFTNDRLLQEVNEIPQLVNNNPDEPSEQLSAEEAVRTSFATM